MRIEDLDHKELLELHPETGLIKFAGQRAVLIDAVAMGQLRKYLVENFGLTAGRSVLTQFGFAHGWRMAETMKAQFKWESEADWIEAGARIQALEGLCHQEPGSPHALSEAGLTLVSSYEAEQHLLHFGRSEVPVCWSLCGLKSGYLGKITGKELYVLEDRCIGKGDPACHLVAYAGRVGRSTRGRDRLLRTGPARRISRCLAAPGDRDAQGRRAKAA